MFAKITQHIEPRHIGLLALCGLAFLYMAMFRYDVFGIEEGAARALLINWSIIDQVANATPLFGVPDLRAIMFMFLDIHWAGSLPAAKVFTLFMLLGSSLMLYRWAEAYDNSESAVIATALLLISPVTVMQVDSISPGVFLLFTFATAFWLENIYRHAKRPMAGSLFTLMLMCGLAVSLHPMGLALPLALLLLWLSKHHQHADDGIDNSIVIAKRLNLLVGIAISTSLVLLARLGWPGLADSGEYLGNLATILTGTPILQKGSVAGYGLIIASLLGFVIALYIYRRNFELFSLSLVIACLLGLIYPDESWALMALACLLFLGFPMLIAAHRRTGIQNIIGQRGLVLLLIIVCASVFTSADKHYRIANQLKLKSDTDYLISAAANIAKSSSENLIIASQWPARTMLATQRDVLPLPPKSILQDPETFIKKTASVTHFMFDQNNPNNADLSRMSASLGKRMEAIEIMPAGVIVQVNSQPK